MLAYEYFFSVLRCVIPVGILENRYFLWSWQLYNAPNQSNEDAAASLPVQNIYVRILSESEFDRAEKNETFNSESRGVLAGLRRTLAVVEADACYTNSGTFGIEHAVKSRRSPVGANLTQPIGRSARSNQGDGGTRKNVIFSYVYRESDFTTQLRHCSVSAAERASRSFRDIAWNATRSTRDLDSPLRRFCTCLRAWQLAASIVAEDPGTQYHTV
jgi:hypothetical protein